MPRLQQKSLDPTAFHILLHLTRWNEKQQPCIKI